MEGLHYTDMATKIVAKEMKRSLFKNRVTKTNQIRNVGRNRTLHHQTPPSNIMSHQIPSTRHVADLQTVSTPNQVHNLISALTNLIENTSSTMNRF